LKKRPKHALPRRDELGTGGSCEHGQHDTSEEPPRRYVSARATVRTRPHDQCQVVRGNEIWEQVVVGCILHFPDASLPYDVRFTHERTLNEARKLRPGDRLILEQGQFRKRHGRSDAEFRVKRFRRDTPDGVSRPLPTGPESVDPVNPVARRE